MSRRQIETTVDIAASVERVWTELTSFGKYREWSHFILGIDGEPRAGTKLEVRLDDGSRPMTIRPVVLRSSPSEELRWKGKLGAEFLFSGEHYFQLRALPDGRTRLTHGEIFCGILTPLLWGTLNTRTRKAFGEFNEALRVRAES